MPRKVVGFEIPKKYGLRHTIADTQWVEGRVRTLRTVPVLQGILNDTADVCLSATMLNYINPMMMPCIAINSLAPELPMIGLLGSGDRQGAVCRPE